MNDGRMEKIGGYVSAVSLLAALGCVFLPLLKTATIEGEEILFYGWRLLFGGREDALLSSGVYSFSFSTNIYLLVATQTFLLAAVSCFLGKQSVFNRIFSIVLAIAGIVLLSLSPIWVSKTSSLPRNSLNMAYGYVLSSCLAFAAVLIEVFLLVLAFAKRKKRA